MSASPLPLSSDEQATLAKAAYGAMNLVAIAYPGPIATTKANMAGATVLANATGAVGRIRASKNKIRYEGKTTTEIAGEIRPALTATTATLIAKHPTSSTSSAALSPSR